MILVDSYYSEELKSPLLNGIVTSMFKEWLNENINKFENIFSYFLLQETAKDENFQWLKPTTAYYGVASVENNGNPDLDKSVFSVMAMVENHKNEFPQHTVDARLLHAVNNESAFGIDMPLFVDKFLTQGLNIMQVGTPDEFEKTNNGLFIQNKNKIKFGNIQVSEDKYEDAWIDPKKFKLDISNNQLVLDIEDLTWQQARGIIGHVNYNQHYTLNLKSGIDKLGKEYKNVLIPTEANDPTLTFTYTLEDWYQREQMIVEIAVGMALSVATGILFSAVSSTFRAASKYIQGLFKKVGNGLVRAVVSLRELMSKVGVKASQEAINEGLELTARNLSRANSVISLGSEEVIYQVVNQQRTLWSRIWEISWKTALVFSQMVAIAAAGMVPTMIYKYLEYIAKEEYSKLPTINEFLANCVGAVRWPDNSEFKVETAQLQGIYLMGGRLNK